MYQNVLLPMACLGLAFVLTSSGCNNATEEPPAEAAERSSADLNPFQLTIEFGDSRDSVVDSLTFTENLTALDLLLAIAAKRRIEVDYDGQGASAFVTAIDGVVGGQDGNEWWIYTINGELANVGSGALILQEGDQVLWKPGKYPE